MAVTDDLYQLFDVLPGCTDDELRRAYHRAILEHHPDRNPLQIDAATIKTQELTVAYAELKKRRARGSPEANSRVAGLGFRVSADGIEVTIQFSTFGGVDIQDIANRKADLRNAWEKYQRTPSDPITALQLVHAAFRAEQQKFLKAMLLNSVLIDSASLLLSLVKLEEACTTLIKWAEYLADNNRGGDAVQILEDAFSTGQALPFVADRLRGWHYAWAQYSDPTTGHKATPDVRIQHLRRILELGFKYDYIYKLLAEAYHDLGDDKQAQVALRQAYALNPELSGAVRIGRALGFTQKQNSARKPKTPVQYKYSRPAQLPAVAQLSDWVQTKNWDAVLEYANPNDYSPRILPRARDLLRQIANSLEGCKSQPAIDALLILLKFSYYWDVSAAALTSLSKVGDQRTLDQLLKLKFGKSPRPRHWHEAISYLRGRVGSQQALVPKEAAPALMSQAKKAFAQRNYGQTRVVLENLLAKSGLSKSQYGEATVLLAQACAEMNDVRTSVNLIKPVLAKLPEKSRIDISRELVSWLWDELVFQTYAPADDENYLLALTLHFEFALAADTPDEVLENLWRLTRWLELLGAGESTQWLRELIRSEAPGTRYVDRHNREQYIRTVELSQTVKVFLVDFDRQLKSKAMTKLKRVLDSPHSL